MKTKTLFLVLAVGFAACVRRPSSPPVPREDDTSIALPNFHGQPAVAVGAEGQPYELDGAVMRALMIATNDYIPPGAEERPCWGSPQAHRYRVIRQGDIIFIDIEDDLEACGLQYVMLHSGVTYAISIDGRILRRVAGGSLDGMLLPEPPKKDGVPPPLAVLRSRRLLQPHCPMERPDRQAASTSAVPVARFVTSASTPSTRPMRPSSTRERARSRWWHTRLFGATIR